MSDFAAEEKPSETIDDNINIVTYITLSRIYDVLCLIADGVGKGEEVLKMIEAHRNGELLGPLPALNSESESEAE
jgi:hypothetical protein